MIFVLKEITEDSSGFAVRCFVNGRTVKRLICKVGDTDGCFLTFFRDGFNRISQRTERAYTRLEVLSFMGGISILTIQTKPQNSLGLDIEYKEIMFAETYENLPGYIADIPEDIAGGIHVLVTALNEMFFQNTSVVQV